MKIRITLVCLKILIASTVFPQTKVVNTTVFQISKEIKQKAQGGAPDYSSEQGWAVIPGNYGEDLNEFIFDAPYKDVDVFYVYPTLLVAKSDKRWNIDTGDTKHKNKVRSSAVVYQASAWANTGNLYVPFYRQAHLRSYSEFDSGGREALLKAYADVKIAFEYYLEHFNKGRGIILAGHSQGASMLALLLEELFDNTALQKQLIAAYLPGIGIEKTRYQKIRLMKSKEEIGGYVTWNTFKKKYDLKLYDKWYKGKAVINPVTWDTSSFASRNQHKGFLFSNGKMYKQSFDTHLGDGVIWITTPHFPYRYMSISMKNYHVGDVNLFWEDIRINSRLRAAEYLKQKKQ
jgi:hypothetical protein